MVYVTSDLHGYPLEKFQSLLDQVGFSQDDFLFVLGDVIDRGAHGAELLRWLAQQSNVQLILGNHEWFLLSCEYVFEQLSEDGIEKMNLPHNIQLLSSWVANGATPTLDALHRLLTEEPDVLEGILDYLHDAPLYEQLQIEDKRYILVHAGLGNFRPEKPLACYTEKELPWDRPRLDTQYYSDATVIFGHTPTEYYGEQYRGKAIKTDSWICIDAGVAMGHDPMLLRLDDLQEFYMN